MAFSASTCITNVGTESLGPTLRIYGDPISPTLHGQYLQDVSTSLITGANCPYTYLVPDTVTIIRIFDPTTFCYVDFSVNESSVCINCNLSLNNVSNNLIGTINVGNLTGTCDPTITDYKISWYGPNSSTNVAFTSGKGTTFPGYSTEHPLTGSSAPLLLPGTYVSRITDVELNGVDFSVTGGSETEKVLSSGLTACSISFNVSAYTCSNGTYSGPYYEHEKEFITSGAGATPQSLQTAFQLSANTQSFIWEFYGYTVYDTLKLTFSGSSYSEPLVLENIRVGGDAGTTDFNPTIFPKLTSSQSYKKITNLSGLTVNEGDLIIIQITPNESQNNTSWKLRFGCYGQPTAEKNCLDTYKNQSYKIKKDSIFVSTPDSCGLYYIEMDYSGCSTNQNSGFTQSDLVALSSSPSMSNVETNNTTNLINRRFGTFTSGTTSLSWGGPGQGSTCMSTTGNIIKITKTVGQLSFFFSDFSDLAGYSSSFYNLRDTNTGQTSTYTGSFINDNSTLEYFRMVELTIPSSTVSSSSVCDTPGISWSNYSLHVTTTVTTGTTTGGWYLNFNVPSIVNNFTGCTSCYLNCPERIDTMISEINSFYNTTFAERTYTNGLRYGQPFFDSEWVRKNVSLPSTASTVQGQWSFYTSYNLNTYPASGITNTLIPSLSATTWDFPNHSAISQYSNASSYYQDLYETTVQITSTTPTIEFKIYSKPISNWIRTGSLIEIYDSTNPTGFNSNYMY